MDRKEHWEGVYSRTAPDRVSWFQERPHVSLGLITGAVQPDAGVIDVGGGASTLADSLLGEGFGDLTVLDLSGAALDAARARLGSVAGEVDWIEADVLAFRPERQWDLWHDRAVFHFLVDPRDRAAYRETLLAGLKPGGHLVIATFALDGPEKCSGLPVVRYDTAGLSAELGPQFQPVGNIAEQHTKPDGGMQSFQYAHFLRSA